MAEKAMELAGGYPSRAVSAIDFPLPFQFFGIDAESLAQPF
jgi:hypothetical protein